jgi:exosortase B
LIQVSAEVTEPPRRMDLSAARAWPVILGLVLLAVPTMGTLSDQVWSRDYGAHGPLIISTGLWLLWRQFPALRANAAPGHPALTALIMVPALGLYVFGRAYDFIMLETAGLYGAVLGVLHSRFGLRAMLKEWFPFFYLGLAIPPPNWLMLKLTAPLKEFVSFASTDILRAFDIPVAREGVTLFVAQYQLLVEDACSGMNSLIGLTALGLFYIYLVRGTSVLYALVLTCLIIPIAIVANILRIMILILLTYFYGDEVAQGFLHFAAGIFLFSSSLLMVFLVDSLLFRLFRKAGRAA